MESKIKINKWKLRDLILKGISSEELNSKYNYSEITDMGYLFNGRGNLITIPELDTSRVKNMRYMFDGCNKLRDFDPYNFPLYDFSRLPENEYLRENYPEFFI